MRAVMSAATTTKFHTSRQRRFLVTVSLLFGWLHCAAAVAVDDVSNTEGGGGVAEASSASCASLQSQLEQVTQDWSYCRATSSATEIRERMLLERLERMEESLPPPPPHPSISSGTTTTTTETTCTTDSIATEQVQTLEATVAKLQLALQTSEQTVVQMTAEHRTLQLTLDDLHEQLTSLQATKEHASLMQEKQSQLQSQHDQLVSEMTLLRQRIRESDHQQEQDASSHQLGLEQVRALGEQTGRSTAMQQVQFWVTQFNRQRTTLIDLTNQMQKDQTKRVAVQRDLFDLRRAWHNRLERDRTKLLRRQLLVQSLFVEPWQYVHEAVTNHSIWIWFHQQPTVLVLQKEWHILVHQRFPVWKTRMWDEMNSMWQTLVQTLDVYLSPHMTAIWDATDEPRTQVWTVYETVVLPSPVVQTILVIRDSSIRFLADVLVIGMHTVIPHTLQTRRLTDPPLDGSSTTTATFERLSQFVEDHPEKVIGGVFLAIAGMILVSFLRSLRRRKPKME